MNPEFLPRPDAGSSAVRTVSPGLGNHGELASFRSPPSSGGSYRFVSPPCCRPCTPCSSCTVLPGGVLSRWISGFRVSRKKDGETFSRPGNGRGRLFFSGGGCRSRRSLVFSGGFRFFAEADARCRKADSLPCRASHRFCSASPGTYSHPAKPGRKARSASSRWYGAAGRCRRSVRSGFRFGRDRDVARTLPSVRLRSPFGGREKRSRRRKTNEASVSDASFVFRSVPGCPEAISACLLPPAGSCRRWL